MPKIKQVLEEKSIFQKDLAEKLNLDVGEMSKIARGRVLPAVETLKAICAELESKPLDLYEKAEIDLLSVLKEEKEGTLEPHFYRLSVRLPREWCGILFSKEKMQKCGYKSITQWLRKCLGRLSAQYYAILKWEEKKNATARKVSNEPKLGGNSQINIPDNRKTAARG